MQRALGITSKGRLALALARLERVDELPDEVASRLADAINEIARRHAPRSQPQRCPLVGRISA